VKGFFYKHYLPNNANLVVAGNVTVEQVKQLCKKWFEPIPAGNISKKNLPVEGIQTSARFLETSAKVPLDAIYKVYHTQGRHDLGFNALDLASDMLGRSKSSRLYNQLVKENQIFNSVNAYVTASLDPGLMVIQGNLNQGVSIEEGDAAIQNVLDDFIQNPVSEEELTKVKNQAESTLVFSEVELLNRAMNLAFAANAGNVEYANQESANIQAVTTSDIANQANKILTKENCSTMYYRAEN
jgi:predicted Zn-dependent peptidase